MMTYKKLLKMKRARDNFYRFNFHTKRRRKRKLNKWINEFNRLVHFSIK